MVIWLIGMSGAGKTTIGRKLYEQLKPKHSNLVYLDGDILREVWGDSLGHTIEARRKNSDRICALCKMLDDQGIHVVASVLSIFPEAREGNRRNLSKYFEVYVKVSRPELERRDSKGLYAKARAGELKNVVGCDIPFPEPESPDLVVENEQGADPDGLAASIARKAGL